MADFVKLIENFTELYQLHIAKILKVAHNAKVVHILKWKNEITVHNTGQDSTYADDNKQKIVGFI